MLNDHSRGYLQNCCYSEQLSMALFHVSHPPAQTCGGKDILYKYFFLIFLGHRVLDPITNPYVVPPLGCTLLHYYLLNSQIRAVLIQKTLHESKLQSVILTIIISIIFLNSLAYTYTTVIFYSCSFLSFCFHYKTLQEALPFPCIC